MQEIAADRGYRKLSIRNLADGAGFKTGTVTRTIHFLYEGAWENLV
jgi:hypothetical protein